MNHRVVLMVLDGWGIAKDKSVSAIDAAHTPFVDSLAKNPHSQLNTSGLEVGLPEGQMGNSEVGHMNLGAGRVVYQDLVKINKAIEDQELDTNPVLLSAFEKAKKSGKKVHFMGLVSDGGVHSHMNHLLALTRIAKDNGIGHTYLHLFTDGRDCDPKSGLGFVKTVQEEAAAYGGKIASVIGRYYAMDRDQRWERVKLAYDLLVNAEGTHTENMLKSIEKSYAAGVTDEFILPLVATENGEPVAKIEEGDVVLCFNFRTDRGRQITQALTQKDFHEQNMHRLSLEYFTMTKYDEKFQNVSVLFEKDNLKNTIGEVVSNAGKKQIRLAETEKYPHVTFFFSGGKELEFSGEKRILVNSPKVATYDLQPEMSAFEVKDALVKELEAEWPDFVCINFANPDMVGHTGVFDAAVKACEAVDQCVQEVVEAGVKNDYTFIILADHGNSDLMINADGTPNTAHTTNPVPCYLVNAKEISQLKNGKLGDIAPTILQLMGIEIPEEMTGDLLV